MRSVPRVLGEISGVKGGMRVWAADCRHAALGKPLEASVSLLVGRGQSRRLLSAEPFRQRALDGPSWLKTRASPLTGSVSLTPLGFCFLWGWIRPTSRLPADKTSLCIKSARQRACLRSMSATPFPRVQDGAHPPGLDAAPACDALQAAPAPRGRWAAAKSFPLCFRRDSEKQGKTFFGSLPEADSLNELKPFPAPTPVS